MQALKSHTTFGGQTAFWSHDSRETKTPMRFATFIPSGPIHGGLLFLAGLTCTEENFIVKAGAQRAAAAAGLMLIAPDTSPRGLNLPHEHEADDFGSGAGFYLDARTPGYDQHYRMESYLIQELIPLVKNHFQLSKIAISGHSMGGHGALTLGLRHPELFSSVSAFAPIVNPMLAPWGIKAFTGYLGPDKALWKAHDAVALIESGHRHPQKILIHQGSADSNLERQLLTSHFEAAARAHDQNHEVIYADGYDHSYYFVSSFMEEHIRHHARLLS